MEMPRRYARDYTALRTAPLHEVAGLEVVDTDLELETEYKGLPWHTLEHSVNIVR